MIKNIEKMLMGLAIFILAVVVVIGGGLIVLGMVHGQM